MKRAVLYARVSTDEQGKGYSVDTQLENCRSYARLNKLRVVNEYSDFFTGTSLNREGLGEIRELIKTGKIEALVVHEGSRLTRKLEHLLILRKELENAGVDLHYCNRGQIGNSSEDRLISNVEGVFNEYWRDKIVEASKRGYRGKVEAGHWPGHGSPPYGFQKKGEGKNTELIIDDKEANVVRRIFRLYLDGMTVEKIARTLTGEKIPTGGDKNPRLNKRRGSGHWSRTTLYKMLKDETYAGTFYAFRRKVVSIGDEQKVVYTNPDEWVPVPTPAIIDQRTWAQTQKKLAKGRAKAFRNQKYKYLVARQVVCKCGYAMSSAAQQKGKYRYYLCNAKYMEYGNGNCDAPFFRADMVDNVVWGWVNQILIDPKLLNSHIDAVKKKADETLSLNERTLEQIEKELDEQAAWSKQLLKLHKSGRLDEKALFEEGDETNDNIRQLQKERKNLIAARSSEVDREYYHNFASNFRNKLDALKFEDMRGIIEALNIQTLLIEQDGHKQIWVGSDISTVQKIGSI